MNKGFTLIEFIIYMGLFAIVIGGGMVATYQIIQSTDASKNHIIMEEEANFLLRKINWAMTGATVATPTSTTLAVTKGGTTFNFVYISPNLTLGGTQLNSNNVQIINLTFASVSPNGIKTDFTLQTLQNGKNVTEPFSTTKYLRQ